jgi:glutathione S-transferase
MSPFKQKLYNQSREMEKKVQLTRNFNFPLFFFQCTPTLRKACWGGENGREKAVEEATELLKFIEEELKEKKFFGGESIGLVDIVANVIGFWLGVFEEGSGVELLTRDKFPKLCNWVDEYVSSNIIKENLPPRDKLVPFLRNRFGSASASK